MQKKKFDIRIVLFFGILILIGIVTLLFQFMRHVDCEDAKFYVFSDDSKSGESIEFYDQTPNAKSWTWNFGDGTTTDKRQKTFHIYKNPDDPPGRVNLPAGFTTMQAHV